MEEKLEIIIKQNIINCYLLEALILQSGISARHFKKLMKDAGKEANRCYEETARELLDERSRDGRSKNRRNTNRRLWNT